MTHVIYAGIDGTGPNSNTQYEQDFSDSHVNFLNKNWVSTSPFYHRGPTLLGMETGNYAELAYKEVLDRIGRFGNDTPIFLSGYSRGGAAVIEAAKFLKQRNNLPVECLILFDPVDRSMKTGGHFRNTPIVDTVKNVIYAQRHRAAKSRESFSNCGTRYQDATQTSLQHKWFFGTHGGLGGCPWKIPDGKTSADFVHEGIPDGRTFVPYQQDRITSRDVRAWMQNLVFDLVFEAIEKRKQPPVVPVRPPGNPSVPITPSPGNPERIHIVKPGDWLSKIALSYYGDMKKWEIIYHHPENKKTIGPNPDLIKPGQRLVIP